jgi:hypothetical protein
VRRYTGQGCAKIYCIDTILQYIVHNTIYCGSALLQYNILMAEIIAIQYIVGSRYCNKLTRDIAMQYFDGRRYCNQYIVGGRYCNTIY